MADVYVDSRGNANMIDAPMWMQAPAGEDAYPYSVNALRYLMRGYRATAPSGVSAGTDFVVTPGGGRTVNISKGLAVAYHGDNPEERYAFGSFDPVNIAIPAHTSGTQHHRLIAQALDKQIPGMTSADSQWVFRVVEGTGGVTPGAQSCSASLAVITDSGQTNIDSGDIVDVRAPFDNAAPTLALSRSFDQVINANTRTALTCATQVDDPYNLWSSSDPTKIYLRHPGTYNLYIETYWAGITSTDDVAECGFTANGLSVAVCAGKTVGQFRGCLVHGMRLNEKIIPGSGYYLQPYVYWDNSSSSTGTRNVSGAKVRVQRVEYRAY